MGRFGVGVLLLAGCVEAIPLGSECPEHFAHCITTTRPASSSDEDDAQARPPGLTAALDGAMDASVASPLDAGAMAASPSDARAAQMLDAAVLGRPARFPALQNGTFQLTRGRTGLVATEPLDRILNLTRVEPWSACRIGVSVQTTASTVRGSPMQNVTPTDGSSFVETELMFGGRVALAQSLTEPMRRGERYAFRIDMRASLDANVSLEIWGSNIDCMPGIKLFDAGKAPDGSWKSRCVAFVAPADLSQLMLVPTSRTADGIEENISTERIFIDNLREDAECASQADEGAGQRQ